MRLVLLTGDRPEHRYVANVLCQRVGLHAILVDRGVPRTRTQEIQRLWRRYTLGQLGSKVCMRVIQHLHNDAAERERQLRTVFGPDGDRFERTALVHELHGINTPDSIAKVVEQNPDCLLVYGTGIVGDKTLSKSRLPALNMHTGISPYYRGTNCAFWPLHNGELEMLGATVHECVSKVDAGRVFAVGQAALQADDGLHAVFGRCVQKGADLYVDVIERLESGTLEGKPQDLSIGREYRASSRGLREELRVRRMIKQGVVRRFVAERAQLDATERELLLPGGASRARTSKGQSDEPTV
jgi:methionyl-tRNA formyltransferase